MTMPGDRAAVALALDTRPGLQEACFEAVDLPRAVTAHELYDAGWRADMTTADAMRLLQARPPRP